MKIVRESISFERGGDIKNQLFGFRPGQIIVRELPRHEDLYIFVGESGSETSIFSIKIFEIGKMTTISGVTDIPQAVLVFDKAQAQIRYSPTDYFRFANPIETKMIREALKDSRYQFYISLAKEITGLSPWV